MTHHNLGSSRATPNRLEGFTSKSNKYHKDCFTKLKCSNHSQRGISQPKLGFLTDHSNLIKRCWGELTKTLGMSIFVGGTTSPQRREGGRFYTYPTKTRCWELAIKTRISSFGIGTSRIWIIALQANRTLRFGKPDCTVFSGSVICVVYEAIVFHPSHLGF
jgi:hypothetical protein